MNNLNATLDTFAAILDTPCLQEADRQAFGALLAPNDRIPAALSTTIYRNNTIGSRVQSLQQIHPVIETIVGETCFTGMASEFVETHPSRQPDLNLYGQEFADFIADHVLGRDAFVGMDHLPDLARLEYHFHTAYYAAADDTPMQLTDTETSIRWAHSLHILSSPYPVYEIWQGHREGKEPATVDMLDEPQHIVIFRQDIEPEVQRIERDRWLLLDALQRPRTLLELSELTARADIDLPRLLPEMVQRRWLVPHASQG